MRRAWIELRDLQRARTLLILPCNAAACVGNYFRAETYSKRGWNTWREADRLLQPLRASGLVAFAALDSSILETQPRDPRGAIVLETEMHRVRNPEGEDWGAPSWRWFRPSPTGRWHHLETLTGAVIRGVQRIESLGFTHVLALVNPRAYFLALAAAVGQSGLRDRWLLFRAPAHPRYLLHAVGQVAPFVRGAAAGRKLGGGVYLIPDLHPILRGEAATYRDCLPAPWQDCDRLPTLQEARTRWAALMKCAKRRDDDGHL